MQNLESRNQWPADGSLPEKVQRFVEWLVTPKWERAEDESSQRKWAVKNGVAAETTSTWKRDTRVKRAIEKRCEELNLSPDRLQDVMNAVYKAATEGDMKAATLFMQHADKLKPTRLIIEDHSIAKMSDAELAAALQEAGMAVTE